MLENLDETHRVKVIECLDSLGQRVRTAFINGHSNSEHAANPVPGLADLLKKCAGLSASVAKKRAKDLIVELAERGWIECRRDEKGRIQSIKIVRLADQLAFAAKIINRSKEQRFEQEKALLAETEGCEKAKAVELSSESPKSRPPKRSHKIRKKGAARRLREAWDRGNRNQTRFGGLLNRFVGALRLCPEIVAEASLESSGRHNPKKGKIDMRDHHGEDFSLFILANPEGRYRLIYDAKSALKDVQAFNRKIYFTREQRDACKKKAILVNDRRSDAEIIEEVLQDLIDSGFSEVARYTQPILERFVS